MLLQIGNAILEFAAEQSTLYEYLWQHAFLSDTGHTLIAQSCKGIDDNSPLCSGAKDTAYNQLGNIDVYNLYAGTCHDKKVKPVGSNCMDLADPCAQYYVDAYLNQPEVQRLIHANTGLNYSWTRCRYVRPVSFVATTAHTLTRSSKLSTRWNKLSTEAATTTCSSSGTRPTGRCCRTSRPS